MSKLRKICVVSVIVFVLAGCGAQSNTMPFYEKIDSYKFTDNASMAIWHDDSEILKFSSEQNIDSIIYVKPVLFYEFNSYSDALVTKPLAGKENYSIYGIYQIDIYDADSIKFVADLSIKTINDSTPEPATFRFSIQEGDSFPVLSETKVESANAPATMEIDLTQYRGRDKFIILSVESQNPSGSTEAYWINPRIHYSFN